MAALKPIIVGLAAVTLLCAANAHAEGPAALTDRQLDQVTAGLAVGVTTGALAGGGVFARTDNQGLASANKQGGFAAGTATAIAPGGSAATGAAVTASGGLHTTIDGTVTGAGGSLSIGFAFVSGGK